MRGWEKIDEYGSKGDVYSCLNAPEIIAPHSHAFVDYPQSVRKIVEILSLHEDRSIPMIVRDLSTADMDVIRFRAPEAEDDGSLNIVAGVEMVKRAHDALLAAACSTSNPRRAFRAGGNKEASEYLDSVRLGQTEVGSFVIPLLSPVAPSLNADSTNQQQTLWPEMVEDPFSRRVTRTLMLALRSAQEAVSLVDRGDGLTAFEDRVERGISANLCEALSGLIRDGDGIQIATSWALSRPSPEPVSSVEFGLSDAETLKEAARQLKDKEPRPAETLSGLVTKLASEEQEAGGRVTIKAEIDGVLSSVRTDFSPDEYPKIVDAHKNYLVVSIQGDLYREGQRWTLRNPRDLEIQSPED